LKILVSHIILVCLCFISVASKAQQQDSLKAVHKKDSLNSRKAIYSSARKATIMSACLPGLGQIYNKKYWKVPIIYAALGGITYWGINNQKQYKEYSNSLRAIYDDDPETNNTTIYTDPTQLVTQKKYYRKYRDIAIMLGSLVYIINIIDANVDAHLKTFDVSDDLSMQVKPYSNIDYNNKFQAGLSLKLTFK
jgi:Family of unknown function (DUF5683)